jgi:hypothetical protein
MRGLRMAIAASVLGLQGCDDLALFQSGQSQEVSNMALLQREADDIARVCGADRDSIRVFHTVLDGQEDMFEVVLSNPTGFQDPTFTCLNGHFQQRIQRSLSGLRIYVLPESMGRME